MTKQIINVGATANDRNGDSLRAAFQKVNTNFTELYTALGLDVAPLNLGAFEFVGSTLSTTDSSAIVIDQAVTVSSNLTVGGDVLPSVANGGDLGSLARPWNNLYVSNNTIYLGNIPLGLDINNNLTVNGLPVTGEPSVTTGATAPADPSLGDLWYDTESGRTYVYYDASWVDSSPVSSTNQLVNGAYSLVVESTGALTANVQVIISENQLAVEGNGLLQLQSANGPYISVWNEGNTKEINLVLYDGVMTEVPPTWSFDTTGILTLPEGSTIGETPAAVTVLIYGAAYTPFNQTYTRTYGDPTYADQYLGSNGCRIFRDGGTANKWRLREVSTDYYESNDLVTWTDFIGGADPVPTGIVSQKTADITVGTNTWAFGTDGKLTLPDSATVAVGSEAEIAALALSYTDYRDQLAAAFAAESWTGAGYPAGPNSSQALNIAKALNPLIPDAWITIASQLQTAYDALVIAEQSIGFNIDIYGRQWTFTSDRENVSNSLLIPENTTISGPDRILLRADGNTNKEARIDLDAELNRVSIGTTNRTWAFSNDGVLTLPTVGKIGNGAAEWTFTEGGTLVVPSPQSNPFTLEFTATNYVATGPKPTLALTDTPWTVVGQYVYAANGDCQLTLAQIGPNLVNPGYESGDEFTFEFDVHGILGHVLTIQLTSVVQAGPAGWTANAAASQPPEYPSSIYAGGAVKLTTNIDTSWIFGTDGATTVPGSLRLSDGISTISTLDPAVSGGISGISVYGKDRTFVGIQGETYSWNWDFRAFGLGDFASTSKPAIKFPGSGWLQEDLSEFATGGFNAPLQLGSQGSITLTTTFHDVSSQSTSSWVFGTDGTTTFPNGALKIAGNTISNYVAAEFGASGSQLEVSQTKTVITNGVTNSLGGGPSLTGQSLFEVSTNGILSSFQVINSLGEGESALTSEYLTELDNLSFKIGQRVTNDLGDGSEPLVAFSGWTFSTDAPGYTKTLTFPNGAVISDTASSPGLLKKKYSGTFVLDPTWFAANAGNLIETTTVSTIQSTDLEVFDAFSFEFTGYFVPPTSANYTFRAHADETFIFWIGAKALSGYTYANKDMYGDYNGTNPEQQVQSFTIALTAGQFYPIRIQWGNSAGWGQLDTFTWANDAGQANTTDFSGHIYTADTGTAIVSVSDNKSIVLSTDNDTVNNWTFAADGSLTLPIGVSIDSSVSSLYPRIIADSGKAFSVQGQGDTGSAALAWSVDPESAGQYAQIGAYKGGGDNLAKVVIQAQSNSGDAATAKTWKFDETGALTIPGDIKSQGNINIDINLADSTLRRWQFGEDGNLTLPAGGAITSVADTGDVVIEANDGTARTWTFGGDGALTLPASGDVVNSTGVSQLAKRAEGTWTVTSGTNTYSFTVPMDGTYTMWVKGNIPNGIITWNATLSITNSNVPAIGQQYAWNYTGGGSPISLTAIPNQIRGAAGTISTDATYAGTTSNRFDFGISNTSGSSQTIYYGYTKV